MSAVAFARSPSVARTFVAQLSRDLTIVFRSRADFVNPLLFYVMGIALFPLGVGPGPDRLALIASGGVPATQPFWNKCGCARWSAPRGAT